MTTTATPPPPTPFSPSTSANTRASPASATAPAASRFTTLDTTGPNSQRLLASTSPPSSSSRPACWPAGSTTSVPNAACPARSPIPPARPGSSSTPSARPTVTTPCVWPNSYLLGQLPTVVIPPTTTRQWRALIAYRQTLVGRRVAVQNRIRASVRGQGLPAPRGARAWTATGLAGLASWARPLADCAADELWRGLLDLALTEYRQIVRTASTRPRPVWTRWASRRRRRHCCRRSPASGRAPPRPSPLTCTIRSASRPASRCRRTAAWCRGSTSPARCDRRGRITRRGPALLRKLLVECAWVMLRYNAWARAVYQRLSRGRQARKKQAIVALARKLAGALLGDAARPQTLARSAGRPETKAVAVEATASGRGPAAPSSEAAVGRGCDLMTWRCHCPRATDFQNRRSASWEPAASARSFVYRADSQLSPEGVRTKGRRGVLG